MKWFQRFYLDKEKDIIVDLYKENAFSGTMPGTNTPAEAPSVGQTDTMHFVLSTPNHGTGNLIRNLAALCGLPLGVVEHRFIMGVINMEMIMFGTQVKLPSFLYAFAVTIVFTLIVMLLMLKDLRRVEMIESLKSVE